MVLEEKTTERKARCTHKHLHMAKQRLQVGRNKAWPKRRKVMNGVRLFCVSWKRRPGPYIFCHAFRAIHSTKSVEINAHAEVNQKKKRHVNQTQWRAHRKLRGNQYNAVELRKGKAITSIHCREKRRTWLLIDFLSFIAELGEIKLLAKFLYRLIGKFKNFFHNYYKNSSAAVTFPVTYCSKEKLLFWVRMYKPTF